MSRLIAFPYYGGKSIHLGWLLPRLPQTPCYVEPFGGSGAVLLNRDPSDSEIYNDLSGSVVNFFRVLRNHRDELIEQLKLTLYSRDDFNICEEFIKETPEEELRSRPVEWARCFFVGIRQSYMANREDWVASGVESGRVSAWWAGIKSLEATYNRLKSVQIENQDGLILIKRFDKKEVLQYQDPPYLLSTRNELHVYECEFTEEQHVELAEFNTKAECKIALSGYKSKLYTELYEDNDWERVDADYTIGGIGDKGKRTESLWCNYDPYSVRSGNQSALTEFFEVYRHE